MQTDLQVRLLSLFSDLGMRVRAGGAGVVRAMGALLPALAEASEGVAAAAAAEHAKKPLHQQPQQKDSSMSQPPSQTQLAARARSRFSYDNFARLQKEDGARMKVCTCTCLRTRAMACATWSCMWRCTK